MCMLSVGIYVFINFVFMCTLSVGIYIFINFVFMCMLGVGIYMSICIQNDFKKYIKD